MGDFLKNYIYVVYNKIINIYFIHILHNAPINAQILNRIILNKQTDCVKCLKTNTVPL